MDDKFRKTKSILDIILKFAIAGTIIGQFVVFLFLVEPWYVNNYLNEVERLYGEIIDYLDAKPHFNYLEGLFLHDFSYGSFLQLRAEIDYQISQFSSFLRILTIVLVIEIAFHYILAFRKKKYIEPKF